MLKHHYENFIPNVPGQESAGTPATYVLAAGYAGDVPFIVDLDPNGLIGHHEETGFQSVGSGAPMAQQAHALLAHFRMTERDIDYGMVAALRVLDALDASSPSVGGPMDLCRITSDGADTWARTKWKTFGRKCIDGSNSKTEHSFDSSARGKQR